MRPRCTVLFATLVAAAACEGPPGPPGEVSTPGSAGAPGSNGVDGSNGSSGAPGNGPWLTQPGLAISITDLAFQGSSATVAFALTDGSGAPVDASGRLTTGSVELSFVLAQLAVNADGSPGQYTAYTTIQATSGSGATATQVWGESNGSLTPIDVDSGTYTYAFATPATGLDSSLTQTVAAYAVRSSSGAIANTTFSTIPAGGAPLVRQEVTDSTCNACHRDLSHHGGLWSSTSECILCHQPQASDPTTGNTLDFKVMVHMLHDGSSLPSVENGTPYQIVGYGGSVNDYSTVVFPQNIARCAACHDPSAAQGSAWAEKPAKPACTSCHDQTWFGDPTQVPSGWIAHGGGPQPDDAPCAVCHPATGSIAGIADMHLTGLLAPNATTVALAIESITNTGPGQTPVMTFTAQVDGQPVNLVTSPLTGVTATIAGPTTDYTTWWQAKIQGTGAVGTLVVIDPTQGLHSYTFPATASIPASATGSYSVGLEGYLQGSASSPRFAAVNPVFAFAVTDPAPVPRRQIVALDNCNSCHYSLSAHGGSRTNPQYCVLCHDPGTYDSAGAPQFVGSTDVDAEALDFRHFLHKVHAGTQLTEPYVIGGYPLPSSANPGGTPNNFAADRYPAPLTSCLACHAGNTFTLPMDRSAAYSPTLSASMSCAVSSNGSSELCPSVDWTPAQIISTPPETSACTSCHDSPDTLAHAQTMTAASGVEACTTCHGPGAQWDVAVLHDTP
jgi:OmcA/MtrC family decaheme c-type cytochrome